MSKAIVKSEAELRNEVFKRLVNLGVNADTIVFDCRLAAGFWADVVVVDKMSRAPIMAFEIKRMRPSMLSNATFNVGRLAARVPYYLLYINSEDGSTHIARIIKEQELGPMLDWNDDQNVCRLLVIDYDAVKGFAKELLGKMSELDFWKAKMKRVLWFWLPVLLMLFLCVHVWWKCLTWELVAYYAILSIVGLAGCGIPIHLKYRDIELLIGEMKPVDGTTKVNDSDT